MRRARPRGLIAPKIAGYRGRDMESKDDQPRVPLRKAIRSLCEYAHRQLLEARNLREDVRTQLSSDVAMVRIGAAAMSANATSFVAVHDDVFLKALRRLAGMVRLTMPAGRPTLEARPDPVLLESLHTIDAVLHDSQVEFPTPESREARWRYLKE